MWADVIVESFRPGVMKGFGLGYSRLKQINPNVVLTSISNFGQNGPYKNHKATEIVEYATGGPMLFTGAARREPVKHGGRVGMYFAGQVAAIATLSALFRQMGSEASGDHLDISIMETQAGTIDRQSALLLSHVYTGRRYSRYAGENKGFSQVYPGKDGYMDVQSAGRFPRLLKLLNAPDFFEENGVDVTTALATPLVIRKLDAMVAEWVAGRTQGESWAQSQAPKDPVGPTLRSGWRGLRPRVPSERRMGWCRGSPVWTSSIPGSPHDHAAYALADWQTRPGHRSAQPERLLRDSWFESQGAVDAAAAGGCLMSARLPLEGVRIIDMTLAWVGPFGTQLLADWGAEVIRVEPISHIPVRDASYRHPTGGSRTIRLGKQLPPTKSPGNATGTETRFSRFTAATSSA